MMTIRVTVTLRPMAKSRKRYQADFVIDSRSMVSIAPASRLKRAGIEAVGKMTHELPDGTTVEYSFGLVVVELMGEITGGRVIFGPEDAEPVLGMTALASVGVVVDPVTSELKRLAAISLK